MPGKDKWQTSYNVWLEIKLFVRQLTLSVGRYPPAVSASLRAFQEKCQE